MTPCLFCKLLLSLHSVKLRIKTKRSQFSVVDGEDVPASEEVSKDVSEKEGNAKIKASNVCDSKITVPNGECSDGAGEMTTTTTTILMLFFIIFTTSVNMPIIAAEVTLTSVSLTGRTVRRHLTHVHLLPSLKHHIR